MVDHAWKHSRQILAVPLKSTSMRCLVKKVTLLFFAFWNYLFLLILSALVSYVIFSWIGGSSSQQVIDPIIPPPSYFSK